MKVKRFIGNDLSEAMIRVKNELGRDAVILHTRKIKKKGIAGWFGAKLVEVVAAIEEPEGLAPVASKSHEQEVQDALEAIRQISEQKQSQKAIVKEEPVPASDALSGEVDALKEMVKQIMERLEQSEAQPEKSHEIHEVHEVLEAPHKAPEKVHSEIHASEAEPLCLSDDVKAMLRDKELADHTIDFILNALGSESEINSIEAVEPAIRNMLGQPYTIESGDKSQKVYMFVGPTGVGKTTTLAKLAARLSLVENRSVGLITADTFRIAAVEQLRTYSEILGIPLTVIYEAEEIREALNKYKDKDFVLVDTAGRSHKSEELRNDLDNLLKHLKNPEIFLVISLTTGYKDIISILSSYEFLKDYKLLFTKLDEASSLGNILNVKAHTGKPLSYFAIGQSVPDDIEIADVDKVVNFIVGE